MIEYFISAFCHMCLLRYYSRGASKEGISMETMESDKIKWWDIKSHPTKTLIHKVER